jgi:hypothetical protein
MRHSIRIALTVALATATHAAAGHQANAQQQRSVAPGRTVLVYTVSSTLREEERGTEAQAALAERLGRDPWLASLTIDKPHNRAAAHVVARFVFQSEAEHRRWVAGDGGRLIAETLNRPAAEFGARLEVWRFPASELLRLSSGLAPVATSELGASAERVPGTRSRSAPADRGALAEVPSVGPTERERARDALLRAVLTLRPCPAAAQDAPVADLESALERIEAELDSIEQTLEAVPPGADVASTAQALGTLLRALHAVNACPRPLSDATPAETSP